MSSLRSALASAINAALGSALLSQYWTVGGGGAEWTPAEWFLANEQGIWLDPSDMSTMFQDAAGTTPVTAVEQPVGKILDKSGRGNHFSQATSTARPTLSARVNQLLKTEQFDDATWAKPNVTVTANAAVAPDGSTTMDRIAGTGSGVSYIRQDVAFTPSSARVSYYAKADTSTSFGIGDVNIGQLASFNLTTGVATNNSGTNASMTAVGNGVWRCEVTYSPVAGFVRQICYPGNTYSPTTTDAVFVWGAQVESATVATRYQRVNTATDYDTVGFPHYLKFDGVDDSLITGNIDFPVSQRATIVVGTGNRAPGIGSVVSVGENQYTTTGAYGVFSGEPSVDSFMVSYCAGSTVPHGRQTATQPDTCVAAFRMLVDEPIEADRIRARVNGAAVATTLYSPSFGSTGDLGGGSHRIWAGARVDGTFFNGNIHQLLIRHADTTDLAPIETYVADKTGVTL